MQSIMNVGPFQPGQSQDKYTMQPSDSSQFVTILKYIPYRENKYTIMTVPGYYFRFLGDILYQKISTEIFKPVKSLKDDY